MCFLGVLKVILCQFIAILCVRTTGSIVRVGILEDTPINTSHLERTLFNGSDVHITRISVPLDQPFVMLQRESADVITSVDLMLAPDDTCSTMQVQVRQAGHSKKVTCFKMAGDEMLFYPPPLLFSKSIAETVKRLRWSAVIILGNNQEELWSMSHELTSRGVLCLTFQYHSNSSSPTLHQLMNLTVNTDRGFPWNYLLLGTTEGVHAVIRQAEEYDLMNRRQSDMRSTSRWLVVVQEDHLELFHTQHWLDNVAVMAYPGVTRHWDTVRSEDCTGTIYTLMYRKVEDGHVSRRLQTVGEFDCNGNVMTSSKILPNLDFGFNGRLMIASTVRWAPFTILTNRSGEIVFEGLCVDMLHQLSMELNFTYLVKLPVDGEWGQEIAPLKWTGMVGELQRNEIDMTVAALTISSSRLKVMDFTYPFGYDKGMGLYLLPTSTGSQWKTLFYPFTWIVHLCIAISFVFCVAMLCWLQWINRHRCKKPLDLGDTALLMWAMFIRYSHDVKSISTSTSFFIGSVWAFGTITTAVYCGNMMASFAVTKATLPFETLDELAAHESFTWGTQGGTFWVNIFEFGDDYKALWNGMKKFNKTDTTVFHRSEYVHRKKVEEGNYVFFVESDILRGWARENCNLRLLEDSFYQVSYGIGLPLNSPYTNMISARLVAFAEEGLFVAWKKKWWRDEDKCAPDKHIETRVLNLRDLQSAFYILIIGMCLGSVCVMCEYTSKRWQGWSRYLKSTTENNIMEHNSSNNNSENISTVRM